MRHTRELGRLELSSLKRLKRLRLHADDLRVFRRAAASPTDRRAAAHLTGSLAIDLLNSWSNFARAYYVSCMLGTVSKSRITIRSAAATLDVNAAIGVAVMHFKPHANPKADGSWHRREPKWYVPYTLLNLAQHCGFSNVVDVQAAFSGGQARTFQDLPTVRNFFAHRNKGPCDAANAVGIAYGIVGIHRPSDLLLAYATGRTETLIVDWIIDIETVIEFLCY